MFWFMITQAASFVLDLLAVVHRPDHAKDLELLLLRHEIRVLHRQLEHRPHITRWEKCLLAALATKLLKVGTHTRSSLGHLLIVTPETSYGGIVSWYAASGPIDSTAQQADHP